MSITTDQMVQGLKEKASEFQVRAAHLRKIAEDISRIVRDRVNASSNGHSAEKPRDFRRQQVMEVLKEKPGIGRTDIIEMIPGLSQGSLDGVLRNRHYFRKTHHKWYLKKAA